MLLGIAVEAQLQFPGLAAPEQSAKEPVTIILTGKTPPTIDEVSLSVGLRMEKNIHIYSAESLFFRIAIDSFAGTGAPRISLPDPEPFTNFDNTNSYVYVNGQEFRIDAPVTASSWLLRGSIQFQACDSTMCFTPRRIVFTASSDGTLSSRPDPAGLSASPSANANTGVSTPILDNFSLLGSRSGFLNADRFSEFLRDPENKMMPGLESKGFLVIILLILAGGIALNLTPCVLPMIPITIAVLGAGSQARSRLHGMAVGSMYGLAMALTYGILGLAVVLTGTRFGVINSSPVFNILISIVFIVMAMAMFDLLQIDFTRFRKGSAPRGERGKFITVFVMGVVASLLAGACVAPVVISVVLYAGSLYAGGNVTGLLLPFLLGIGMALPWPLAGAGLSFLPKPGKWMVWTKYLFGTFIAAMAIYYGYTGIHLYRSGRVSGKAEQSSESVLGWHTSLEEGLRQAMEEKKPAFIDFWATWCKNCAAMEATTFRNPEVQKYLEKYVVIKYQAEHPDEPDTKRLMDRFGVMGLPTYVIVNPESTTPTRSGGLFEAGKTHEEQKEP